MVDAGHSQEAVMCIPRQASQRYCRKSPPKLDSTANAHLGLEMIMAPPAAERLIARRGHQASSWTGEEWSLGTRGNYCVLAPASLPQLEAEYLGKRR